MHEGAYVLFVVCVCIYICQKELNSYKFAESRTSWKHGCPSGETSSVASNQELQWKQWPRLIVEHLLISHVHFPSYVLSFLLWHGITVQQRLLLWPLCVIKLLPWLVIMFLLLSCPKFENHKLLEKPIWNHVCFLVDRWCTMHG